jgi:HEAT repeat protein
LILSLGLLLRDRRAVEPLIAFLGEGPDNDLLESAAEALGLRHDPRAIAPLQAALSGASSRRARIIRSVLGRI